MKLSDAPSPDQEEPRFEDAILVSWKVDGKIFEGIAGQFSAMTILIFDVSNPIEQGDMLIRTLPSSLRAGFIVDDPGYREALGTIPAHFEVKASRKTPIDSLESSGFWPLDVATLRSSPVTSAIRWASIERTLAGYEDIAADLRTMSLPTARLMVDWIRGSAASSTKSAPKLRSPSIVHPTPIQ
jgi:hypothetical protein